MSDRASTSRTTRSPRSAVATVSGRLIEAQEQERSRLASELHDDINQRLALLAIELEQLRLNPPNARKELTKRIDDLQQTTLEHFERCAGPLARAPFVEARLPGARSRVLEFLPGVLTAEESGGSFHARRRPAHDTRGIFLSASFVCCRRLPTTWSSTAGVRRFDVELRGTADHAHLTIRDAGKGFDPGGAISTRGLGLSACAND